MLVEHRVCGKIHVMSTESVVRQCLHTVISAAHKYNHTKESCSPGIYIKMSAFLVVPWCCHANRHHWVFNQGGCLKSGVDYTLFPLGSRRMIHCVLLIFPGKRTVWASGQGHCRRNAAHLRSTLTTDYTNPASRLCLSRFITNYFCDTGNREEFFLSLPPTPQSPAVLLCWRDMSCTHAVIYTYTIVHFKFCFLFLFYHRGLTNYWKIIY